MSLLLNTQIDYKNLRKINAVTEQALKPLLLDQIEEIFALMYKIDIGIAGNSAVLIEEALGEIKSIATKIGAMQMIDTISLLDKLMHDKTAYPGSVHCYRRMDHLLKGLRHAAYSYQQKVESDL